MVHIVSWNVNSINARLSNVERFIDEHNPDILLLQEIKCTSDKFPLDFFESRGYEVQTNGQKSYNGVSIVSKFSIEDVHTDISDEKADEERRYITGFVSVNKSCIRLLSVYVPQGTEVYSDRFRYKLSFIQELEARIQNFMQYKEDIIVIGGDLNVALEKDDVYDDIELQGSLGFHMEERNALRSALNRCAFLDGWRILNPKTKKQFTWWDYRNMGAIRDHGMRLDYLLVSPAAADILTDAVIHKDVRFWDRPSDHAPISIILGI